MKMRTLFLATTLLTAATGLAFAQSSPAPANTSGGGISATTPSPTDPSTASETGNTKGTPSRATNAQHMGGAATTGSGVSAGSDMNETKEKNVSPASPKEGINQEK